jgi:signal transduction histidine kinase
LEKLIINLVKNSIVYGRENGRTDISVKQTTTYIAITVADNGIGIGKEDLPHIFERFYRADPSRGEGEKGTGLGLAIVKKAVELHGGEISVKSSNHKGSVFTVVLPITRKIK